MMTSLLVSGCQSDGVTTVSASPETISRSPTPSISAGPAAQLSFVTEPSATAGSGTSFFTQPVVQVQDSSGNPVKTATNSVQIAAYTDSACTVSATGTFSVKSNPVSAQRVNAAFSGVAYSSTPTTIYIGAQSSRTDFGMLECSGHLGRSRIQAGIFD